MGVIPSDEIRIPARIDSDCRQRDGGIRAGLRYPLPPLRYGQNNCVRGDLRQLAATLNKC
jgi:hypothetical protein